jgi:hypothetical protein
MGIGNCTDKMGETDMTNQPKNCKIKRGTIWDAERKIIKGSVQTKSPKETRKVFRDIAECRLSIN